jgi:hypothetical protein
MNIINLQVYILKMQLAILVYTRIEHKKNNFPNIDHEKVKLTETESD